MSWGRSVGGTVSMARRGFGRIDDSMKKMDVTGRLFRRTVLALGTAFGTWKLIQVAQGFHQVTVEAERSKAMLEGLYGSAEAGKAAFEWIMRLDVPYGIDAIQDSFVKLRSVGIDPTTGSLEALINGVSAFGGSDEVLKRASIAIQQMAGKGVISMEELRQQLGEAIPTAMILMADQLGMSVRDMVDVISKGNLDATTGLAALFKGLEAEYGGASERMMGTWAGMTQKMAKEWAVFRIRVMESGPFQVLKQYFADLLRTIDRLKKEGKLDLWAAKMADGVLAAIDLMLVGFRGLGQAISGFRAVFGILAEKWYASRFESINRYIAEQEKNIEALMAKARTPERDQYIDKLKAEVVELKKSRSEIHENMVAGKLMAEGNIAQFDAMGNSIDQARGKLAKMRSEMEAARGKPYTPEELKVPGVPARPAEAPKPKVDDKLAKQQLKLEEELMDEYDRIQQERVDQRTAMYEGLTTKDEEYWSWRKDQLDMQYKEYQKYNENKALADKWYADQKGSLDREHLAETSSFYGAMQNMSQRTSEAIESNFSGFFKDVFRNDLKSAEDYFTSFATSISDSFADLMGQMVKEWLFGQSKMGGMGGGGGGFFGDLFGGGAGGGGGGGWASMVGTFASFFHKGGRVGRDVGARKLLPSSMFADAPRLHTGLKSDEYPAVLQRGEEVRSKDEVASGSGMPEINIINVPDMSMMDQWASTSRGQNAILNVIQSNPSVIRGVAT